MPVACEIFYQKYSNHPRQGNPPLVLIHGAGGNILSWPPNLRRMAGYLVYAIDLPGHGSSPGEGLETVDAYAQSLSTWTKVMQIEPAILVGHSMGGAIALLVALSEPQSVKGLVLIGSNAHLSVNPKLLASSSQPERFTEVVSKIIHWSFSHQTPERLKELAALRMLESRPETLHKDFQACNGFDITHRLSELDKPTLIIQGSEDKMTPASQAQAMAAQIRGARLVLIQEAGHMVMLEKQAEVAYLINDYLDSLTDQPPESSLAEF